VHAQRPQHHRGALRHGGEQDRDRADHGAEIGDEVDEARLQAEQQRPRHPDQPQARPGGQRDQNHGRELPDQPPAQGRGHLVEHLPDSRPALARDKAQHAPPIGLGADGRKQADEHDHHDVAEHARGEVEGRVGGAEQGARVGEQELAQRARALGARRRRNPDGPELASQNPQLLADELNEALRLPDQVGSAPDEQPRRPDRDGEAGYAEAPEPADRQQGGEAARAGVEQGSEQQAGEDEQQRSGGLPGQEQSGRGRDDDQRDPQVGP